MGYSDTGTNEEYIMKRFPESENDVAERAKVFTQEFLSKYGYKMTNTKTLHIVVSHGTPIRHFSM